MRKGSTRLLLGLVLALAAAVPARSGDTGKVYGRGVSGPATLTIDKLLADPERWVGKTVRVEGLIVDVCPMRGCWIDLAGKSDFKTVRFKVKDGEIVFPVELKGRRAVVEGVLTRIELTREQAIARARHEAEERGEPFDPASVDGPRTLYIIKGAGAVVR
ncbi:MAG: DUF4920 domain-containing protein [Acidobacteria bacterium]|nr:MAG: DUF4920 domain-containing protein [Acidobacteriota bacterium]